MGVQTDIRVLVPRVRRALEGTAAPALTNDQIKDMVADALADVILYTGSAFGRKLVVTDSEGTPPVPVEYATDTPLELQEQSVIAAQAALTYFFFQFSSRKTMEQIQDEAQTWQVEYSPNLLRDALKVLVDQRDKALEALEGTVERLVAYESFLAVRDAQVSQQVEWWVREGVSWGGMERDYRFGVIG